MRYGYRQGKTNKKIVWSCGGGVQSTAIAVLICEGKLPAPDLSVMADTGREYAPVMDYLKNITIPKLREVGVELHIAGHDLATVDLWSGKDGDTLLIPAFTSVKKSGGMLPRYCSQEWKTRVVHRFCRQHGITDADQWIGFTTDEMDRMRVYREGQPWQHVYPLVDMRLNRGNALALIARAGWPDPPRSACYMCPYRSDEEWAEMIENAPSEFAKAIEFEADVQQRDPNVFLHRSMQPIGTVDFTREPDLFSKPCNAGGCFT